MDCRAHHAMAVPTFVGERHGPVTGKPCTARDVQSVAVMLKEQLSAHSVAA